MKCELVSAEYDVVPVEYEIVPMECEFVPTVDELLPTECELVPVEMWLESCAATQGRPVRERAQREPQLADFGLGAVMVEKPFAHDSWLKE